MLELYNTPHSTCSQKVRICLAEKNLEWTDQQVNLATKEHHSPKYLKINPNGVVLTFIHNGTIITDPSVICEYIDEVFPEPALTPAEPAQKAAMRAWLRFIEEVPTVAVRVPSFNMAFLPRFEGLSKDEFHIQKADIRPLRKQFYCRMGLDGFDNEDFAAALEQIHNTAKRMDKALSAGPWLLGAQYTLADIILAPLLDRMADLGFTDLWNNDFPSVTGWFQRMQERAAFKRTFFRAHIFRNYTILPGRPVS